MVRIKTPLDVLTYLVVVLGIGPLFLWLDPAVRLVVLSAFVGGIVCDIRKHYWFGPRIATALTILFFVIYALQLNLSNVVPPAVNILALLLSIRLLTEKQGRHYLQIFVLSLFCLAGSSLLSLNIAYLPALVLMISGVTIGLVLLTFFHRDSALRLNRQQLFTLLKTAAILPIGSLILMLILFVVLPRTQYPLWNFLTPETSATSGFSEQVRPGAFASNAAVKRVAFRAECLELVPEDLYWRGTVMNTIEGNIWKRVAPHRERIEIIAGRLIDYTITLPVTNDHFLFTLDLPLLLEGVRHSEDEDRIFKAHRRLNKNITYRGQSSIGAQLQMKSELDRGLYLNVPANLSTRIHRIAERINQQTASPHQRIVLLQEFFRAQQLSYADSDLPGPKSPIDEFLFDKKRGYCEFFASSFALLLRLCEIPSRLVGGYYGGEYNNLGGYYLVTEDLAHVWVEALIDNYWQRIDPSSLAVNASSALVAPRQQGLSLLMRAMDSLEYVWTQAVINYDLSQQLNLLRHSGSQIRNLLPRLAAYDIPLFLLIIVMAIVALMGWRWQDLRRTAEQRLLLRYQRAIIRHYHLKNIPSTSGLLEFALQLEDAHAIRFARHFSAVLYSEEQLSNDDVIFLKSLIDAIGSSDGDDQE